MFFYQKGNLFKDKWLYISALISLLIFFPNLIWQIQNEFPLLKHLQALNENQLNEINPLEFALEQLSFPFTLIISLFGLVALLTDKNLKKYRTVGVASMVIFFTMWLLNSKAYYVFAIYPVLFASGAVRIESILSKKSIWVYAIAFVTLTSSVYFIPEATPILPIEKFVKYKNLEESVDELN